jgi:hypothetical protein
LEKIALNFVASDKPLGTPIHQGQEAVSMVSAGHDTHQWTSHSAYKDLFEKMEHKLNYQQSKL